MDLQTKLEILDLNKKCLLTKLYRQIQLQIKSQITNNSKFFDTNANKKLYFRHS